MRQNPEGNHIILKFPRPQNNVHPLQTAGFKLHVLVTLPSQRREHCPIPAGQGGRWGHTETPQFKAGFSVPANGFADFFLYSCGSQTPLSKKEKCAGILVLTSRRCIYFIKKGHFAFPKNSSRHRTKQIRGWTIDLWRDLTASSGVGSAMHSAPHCGSGILVEASHQLLLSSVWHMKKIEP